MKVRDVIRTLKIVHDNGEGVGTIYQNEHGYYHNSQYGVHGPWDTADRALIEWTRYYRKSPQYFGYEEYEEAGE